MSRLRSDLLRIASELPKGDPTRREILAALSGKEGGIRLMVPSGRDTPIPEVWPGEHPPGSGQDIYGGMTRPKAKVGVRVDFGVSETTGRKLKPYGSTFSLNQLANTKRRKEIEAAMAAAGYPYRYDPNTLYYSAGDESALYRPDYWKWAAPVYLRSKSLQAHVGLFLREAQAMSRKRTGLPQTIEVTEFDSNPHRKVLATLPVPEAMQMDLTRMPMGSLVEAIVTSARKMAIRG